MKKLFSFVFVALITLTSFAEAEEVKTIKLGFSAGSGTPRDIAAQEFKKIVEDKSGGSIKVEIYPAAQLGNDRDLIEGVKFGTVEMSVSSAGNFGNYEPKLGISALPFLFPTFEDAWAFMDSDVIKEVNKGLIDSSNIRVLSHFDNGFRCVTNSVRQIKSPKDMEGLFLRTPENPYVMETMKALGASPSPLGFSELYLALQQHTFDGQENPIPVIYNAKLYEVQDNIAVTNHSYDAMPLFINEAFYQSLSDDQKKIVSDAAIAAQNLDRKIVKEKTTSQLELLKEKGMKVTTPDLKEFAAATDKVPYLFKTIFGEELLNKAINFEK